MGSTSADRERDRTLALAAEGDAQAWRRLVEQYSPRVFALLVRQCGDRELADELTQVTFVKLLTQLGSEGGYKERGRFEPWLFRVAVNALRDEMRRRKRQATPMDFAPGSAGSARLGERDGRFDAAAKGRSAGERGGLNADDPAEQVSTREQVELLRAAVGTLSPDDQQILHLRYTAGLSFAQIAETIEQPLGTVLSRGHRAVAKLKKLMMESES